MVRHGDYETMDTGPRWMLRRGKPARTFKGGRYVPGQMIDPGDPNLEDPELRKHLVPFQAPRGAFVQPEPEPAPPPAPPEIDDDEEREAPAVLFDDDPDDHRLGDEDHEDQEN